MDDTLFISDGYTATKTVPAVAGLYPQLVVSYRPALDRERVAMRQKTQAGNADQITRHVTELFQKHRVVLNGVELAREKPADVDRLRPEIRSVLLDLVLGYAPEDQADDLKNSPSA